MVVYKLDNLLVTYRVVILTAAAGIHGSSYGGIGLLGRWVGFWTPS